MQTSLGIEYVKNIPKAEILLRTYFCVLMENNIQYAICTFIRFLITYQRYFPLENDVSLINVETSSVF